MKHFWKSLGQVAFWLAWPAWFVYLRISGTRSRVLVTFGEEVLLVQSWLGVGRWGLPGGGIKRRESSRQGAVRELAEETGIRIAPSQLQSPGEYLHSIHGLEYNVAFFRVAITKKIKPKGHFPEIMEADWFSLKTINQLNLDPDAAYIIDHYFKDKHSQV